MKILLRLAALAALAALGWWLWTVWFPGPEAVIRQRLAELARTATIDGQDSLITRVAKAKNAAGFFTRDAEFLFESTGYNTHQFSGREELAEAARAGFATFRSFAVEFIDVTVQVAADRQSAGVNCTAKVRYGDSKEVAGQEMRFQWRKVDGTWFILRLETVKTLS